MKVDKRIVYTIISIMIVISGLIGYSYINSDLNSSSSVTVNKYNCNQSNLYDRLACMSVMDNVKSKYVSSDMGIDFSNVSSDTNGKGIYTFSSTAGDEYPVYYYRGAVEDNNVKFAGFCWKIVRTTSTGGTKLIYNGEPDENGYCIKEADETRIGSEKFNSTIDNSPAYVGYMYGDSYSYQSTTLADTFWFGDSFAFTDVDSNVSGDGTYELNNLTKDSSQISTHHYTCWNSTGQCNIVSYIYYADYNNNKLYFINIKDGKSINDAINEMNENKNESSVKVTIDLWFNNNLIQWFTDNSTTPNVYLEDTIWCNDRTMATTTNGWIAPDGNVEEVLYYSGYKRREEANPSIDCINKNDSFTTDDLTNGNGKLKYRVGLLTSDEVILAGGNNIENSDFYLRSGNTYWTMTPYYFYTSFGGEFGLYSNGKLDYHGIQDSKGIRPSISLNHSQVISSGDGTKNNPYVIE